MKWILLGVYASVCFGLSCLPVDVPYSESLTGFYFLSMAHIFTVPIFNSHLRAKPVDGVNKTTGKPPADGVDKTTGKPPADGVNTTTGKPPADGVDKTTGKPPADGVDKTTGKPAAGTTPGKASSSAGKAGNPADICVW